MTLRGQREILRRNRQAMDGQSCHCEFEGCRFPSYCFGTARDGRVVEVPRGSKEDHLKADLKKVYYTVGFFILCMENAGSEGHRCYHCFDLFYDRVLFVEHLRDYQKSLTEQFLDLLDARQRFEGKSLFVMHMVLLDEG